MAQDLSARESFSSQPDDPADGSEQDGPGFAMASGSSSQPGQDVGEMLAKFSSTKRGSFRVKAMDLPMLQKPEEPDFSSDAYN